MSYSPFFKNLMMKKFEKENKFLVYKESYAYGSTHFVPLKICNTSYNAMEEVIKYNIDEFHETYIISKSLLYTLCKPHTNRENLKKKYNAILKEYQTLFDKTPNYKFKICYMPINENTIIWKTINRRLKYGVYKKNYNVENIKEYISFYYNIKKELNIENDNDINGSIIAFL